MNGGEQHVQISDFSDRELLGILYDLGGWGPVTSRDVALRIFALPDLEDQREEISYANKCVSIRFSWMRRFGLIEKAMAKGLWVRGEWQISPEGRALMEARLSSSVSNGVEKAQENTNLELAHIVGEKLVRSGRVTGRAMQRELVFQITRRKRTT